MSQRELLFVLAHAQLCAACRGRLLSAPQSVFAGHALTDGEKEALARLHEADFFTPERLGEAAGVSVAELNEHANHPVVRLRHL
ncbi:MAG: hypothetical protein ACP5UQ_17775 [Anaerolineae bacterium]